MKKHILVTFLISAVFALNAQDKLTLSDCQEQAIALSPLQQQTALLESMSAFKQMTIATGKKPQFDFGGRLSFQSDVFELPFALPNAEAPTVPKTQYQMTLSINQRLYDGGVLNYSTQVEQTTNKVNQQGVVVELNTIKEVINTLYFNALVLQENQNLLETSILKELESQLKIMKSRIANGVAMESNAIGLEIQIKKTQQQIFTIEQDKNAMLAMLGKWLERDLSQAVLEVPKPATQFLDSSNFDRPEYQLFDFKKQQLEASKRLIDAARKPQLSAFVNAGIGSPNPYNFFETELSPFYMTGLQLRWKPFDYKNSHREKQLLSLSQQLIDVEKSNLDRNLSIALTKARYEGQKFEQLIAKDKEIIDLQEEMVKQATAQLQHGVITSTNYITELNAKTQAQLNLQIHQLQMTHAVINQLTIAGHPIN